MTNMNNSKFKEPFAHLLPLKRWIEKHSISSNIHTINMKKSLGQNFLLNLDITDKISLLASIPQHEVVMEIGPGLGSLTISLLSNYLTMKKLYVLEMDYGLKSHLENIQAVDNRLEIIMGDCMNINIPLDVRHMVANLPYNVSVPFIIKCLQNKNLVTMTFLVQKEVGERFISLHNKKSYGKISILAQLFSKVSILYKLGPKAFTPPPKVDSLLLRFERRNDHLLHLWPLLEDLVRLMFQHRRKVLRSTVGKKYPLLIPYMGKYRCEHFTPEQVLEYANLLYENQNS